VDHDNSKVAEQAVVQEEDKPRAGTGDGRGTLAEAAKAASPADLRCNLV